MRRHHWYRLALVGGLAVALGGCQSVRQTLGLDQPPPDEFVVPPEASLLMPPDFSLRPPQPGAPNAHAIVPRNEAETALLGHGGAGGGAPADPGLTTLLDNTGGATANPAIRQLVNGASADQAERSDSFVSKLLFWRKQGPPGVTLDPAKEAERLRADEATGQPITSGQVPVIKRQQKGWLQGIF